MRAAVLYDVERMAIRDVPTPPAGPRDVVLRVAAVGLCGTDFHIFQGHGNYNTDSRGKKIPLTEHPQILGHEIVGRVEHVGEQVRDVAPGDRVIVDQGLNCHSAARRQPCEYCATGASHQCEHYQEHGITGPPGGLADYFVAPAVNVIRATSDRSDRELALSEPLACIIHAVDAGNAACGRYQLNGPQASRAETVLVTGAGPAGLLFVQYLRAVAGFDGQLIVSEPDRAKRALAEQFGADTIDPAAVNVVDALLEATGGRRADWLIEASGSARVFTEMPALIRNQGTVLLYGHGHTGVDLSVISNLQYREPALVCPTGASSDFDPDGRPRVYRQALDLLESGRIKVAPFLTHRYHSLEAVPAAFSGDHREAGYVKGTVELG